MANKGLNEHYTIYSLINLESGKRYIGRTKNLKQRIQNHFSCIKGKNHPNPLINQDSECHFDFEVLEENVSGEEKKEKERYYIQRYKTYDERYGYNVMDHCVATIKSGKVEKKHVPPKRIVEEMSINVAKIRRLRNEKGLTQEDLARLMGASHKSTICKLEKEPWNCTLTTLNHLAKALNCSPLSLVKVEEREIEESCREYTSQNSKN